MINAANPTPSGESKLKIAKSLPKKLYKAGTTPPEDTMSTPPSGQEKINQKMNGSTTSSTPTMTPPSAIPQAGMPANTGQSGSGSSFKTNQKKKILGVDPRSLATVVGLTLFFVVAMAGVMISLRTRFGPRDFSPTAPERPSADVVQVANCSLTFDVAAEYDIACVKTTYQDELANTEGSYQLLTEQSTFKPGDIIVFTLELTNSGASPARITAVDDLSQLAPAGATFTFTFLDSDCAGTAYDEDTQTLTCTSQLLEQDESETFTFRIQVGEDSDSGITLTNALDISFQENNQTVVASTCEVDITIDANPSPSPTPSVSPSPSPTPSVSPSPSPSPVVGCNEVCDANSDCASSSQICYNGFCREVDYPEEADCIPDVVYATPSPTPPIVGCNYSCVENVDCADANHICYNGQCRHVDYPQSPNCYPPVEVVAQPNQPVLPPELPRTGSDDSGNLLKAALGILGVGALLLLLL